MKNHFGSFYCVSLVSLCKNTRTELSVLCSCFLLCCDTAFCRSTEIHLLSITVFCPDATWRNLLDQNRADPQLNSAESYDWSAKYYLTKKKTSASIEDS